MDNTELRRHVSQSYTSLRIGIGVLAILFPFILLLGGMLGSHTPMQGSMSAYYYTPMRNYFVGILFAIGAFLYLYKGFTWKENHALNVAGILAILIAVIPTDPYSEVHHRSHEGWLHLLFGYGFFLMTALVCIFLAPETLKYVRTGRQYSFFLAAYRLLGIAMIAIPAAVFFVAKHYQKDWSPEKKSEVFYLEVSAFLVFGAYWLLKSLEIHSSQADTIVKASKVKSSHSD